MVLAGWSGQADLRRSGNGLMPWGGRRSELVRSSAPTRYTVLPTHSYTTMSYDVCLEARDEITRTVLCCIVY